MGQRSIPNLGAGSAHRGQHRQNCFEGPFVWHYIALRKHYYAKLRATLRKLTLMRRNNPRLKNFMSTDSLLGNYRRMMFTSPAYDDRRHRWLREQNPALPPTPQGRELQ